jgi:radical SAM protein with 4Fe4S-binding SPASM domain
VEQVESLVNQWEEIVLRDRGRLGGYFHLKGGEPLVVPYFVELLDLIARKGTLRFMMTTNGTFLRERDVEALRNLNDAVDGEAIIIVSLDGSCENVNRVLRGPGQFAKTLSFAEAMVDSGINLHFNYVVHSGNLDDVLQFVTLAESIGATQINFLPMVPKGYGMEMGDAGRPDPEKLHRLLLRLYREGGQRRKELLAGNYAHILDLERRGVCSSCECVAGYRGLFYITPEGNVYSCPNLVNSELRLGNFQETALVEIHDHAIDRLYASRIASGGVDDRYLCRGERLMKSSRTEEIPAPGLSLPILGQADEPGEAYPDPIRRLQEILLCEGLATRESGRGTSYCFSRNF